MTDDRTLPLAGWISLVLRVGTFIAVALTAVGFAWASLTAEPRTGAEPVVAEMARGGGDGLAASGLLALTLVPIVMLAAAAVALGLAGERRMGAAASGVALLLAASLVTAAVIGPVI